MDGHGWCKEFSGIILQLGIGNMSNEEIVKNIQNGINTTKNQECLWLNNRGMVYRIIRRCGIVGGDSGLADDLAQQGFIGLINAALKYNPDGNAGFLSYSIPFIRGAIYSYLASTYNCFHIPQYMRKRIRDYGKLMESGRSHSDREICAILHLSGKQLGELKETLNRIRRFSLDESAGDTDRRLMEYIASDEDMEDSVVYGVYEMELHKALGEALSILDDTTLEIIKCVYYMGFSRAKVAEMAGCSHACICSKIERGFQKILKSRYRETLESFMWEGFRYRHGLPDDGIAGAGEGQQEDGRECNLFLL